VNNNETTRFQINVDQTEEAEHILGDVLAALKEKGYEPIGQLVGYFLSGDPTYITNHNGARGKIRRMERDELLEVILASYLQKFGD
jgi:uncharacterized protein (UPF0297 family)